MSKWSMIGKRSYSKNSADFNAFVFGATTPICMWAWSVYWRNGHASWVESSFQRAKAKADECMAEITERASLDAGPCPEKEGK